VLLSGWAAVHPTAATYTATAAPRTSPGIFIVAVIGLSAALAAWQAVARLVDPQAITNPGWVAAAGVVGFAGNELVASYRIRVRRRIGSAALVADGRHAHTDGLTSLAVLAAALGTMAGWRLADPVVGLAICAAILKVLHAAARDISRRLTDRIDPDLVDRINEASVAGDLALIRCPQMEGLGIEHGP
jgi:cation diffusion facilitator family transporter